MLMIQIVAQLLLLLLLLLRLGHRLLRDGSRPRRKILDVWKFARGQGWIPDTRRKGSAMVYARWKGEACLIGLKEVLSF